MIILGLDPGNTTGWAIFKNTSITSFGQLTKKEVDAWLIGIQVDLVICEDYKIRPSKLQAHTWSSPFTLQLIGSIKTIFKMRDIPVIMQQPSVKPMGYGWMGMEYKKGKPNMHSFDAMCHVVFYLVKTKGVNPACLTITP